MEIGIEIEILLDGKILVEPEFLRHVADAVLDRLRIAGDIDAEHGEFAGVGRHEAGNQPDERRLAGSVWPDQRCQPAMLDSERDIFEGGDRLAAAALELLADAAAFDDGDGSVHFCAGSPVR